MIEFKTYRDKNHPQLREFRKNIFIDCGVGESEIDQFLTRKAVDLRYQTIDSELREEVYKAGRKKWSEQNFYQVEAVLYENKIASISGCEIFNNQYMRVGMNLYTVKKLRSQVRGHMFSEKGFFSRHLKSAKKEGLEALFLSVYPHTKKLEAHAKNLSFHKRSFVENARQPYLLGLEAMGIHKIKNVQQYVIGYPIIKNVDWSNLFQALE